MGDTTKIPVSFSGRCETAGDVARRYRVLAAMSAGGVTFTMSPEQLRAEAELFEALEPVLAAPPRPWVVEVEPAMGFAERLVLTVMGGCHVYFVASDMARMAWGAW